MSKGILAVFVVAVLGLGCAGVQSRAEKSGSAPVLEKVFVAPEINHGEMLKIYVKGHDPDGHLKAIAVETAAEKSHVGTGYYSVTRVKKEDRADLSGYLYWDTKKALRKDGSGTIEIFLEDQAGNSSNVVSVPLKIVSSGAKFQSPPGEFKDKELGPVMIEPVNFSAGGK
jgi:hypothetical protein